MKSRATAIFIYGIINSKLSTCWDRATCEPLDA